MQLNLINVLASNNPTPAPDTSASDGSGGDGSFALALDDASTQPNAGQTGKQRLAAGDATGAALIAQELSVKNSAAIQHAGGARLEKLLAQPIGTEQAKALLGELRSIAALPASTQPAALLVGEQASGQLQQSLGQGGHEKAFDQLREALEDIEHTGEPVDVAGLLDTLPAVEQAETQDERGSMLQRLLGFVQSTLDKQKEAPQQAAVPSGTLQSLQAAFFSASDDAFAVAQAQKQSDDEGSQITAQDAAIATRTVVVPLAFQAENLPAWVRKIGTQDEDTRATRAIDAAIPPLTVAKAPQPLPYVDLPDAQEISAIQPSEEDAAVQSPPTLTFKPLREPPVLQGLAQDPIILIDGSPAKKVPDLSAVIGDHVPRKEIRELPAITTDGVPHSSLRALPETLSEAQAARIPVTQTDATGAAITTIQGITASHNTPVPLTLHATSHVAPHVAAAEQVQVAITSARDDGVNRITLQLEPAELGRVEIKMDIGSDGRTQLSFMVDKPETLDALSRDARGLERWLQEAGIKADAGSMQFNLRQQPQPEFSEDTTSRNRSRTRADDDDTATAPVAAGITRHYTINVREGVDIHA